MSSHIDKQVSLASDLSLSLAISGYYDNELSNINALQLCYRSRMTKQSFVSVYCLYALSINNILMWVCEVYYVKEMVYD
jgi:hypothetical protein